MKNLGRWRLCAMTSAIAFLGSLASLEAHAVSLGRITVQSALGEALRAEVDVSDLNADEASSLQVGMATPDAFRAAGLEYPSSAAGMSVKLQRRADGRSYLRLSSNRAITEPFVDLILEAKWSSGRVTRDYTMLFDPPNLRGGNLTSSPSTPLVLSRAPVRSADMSAREPAPQPVARAPSPRTPAAERSPSNAKQITVQAGDNASRIAAQTKPSSVSLDQMLVALLRSNPNAFIGGNINILKSGAVLDIPDAQAANALSPGEATKTLIAQSADFNNFRRKLAEGVPAAQTGGNADRQIGGKLQTKVEDSAQANTTPDKLTLSKGAVQGKPATDQEIKDAVSRAAELSKINPAVNQPGPASAASTTTAAPGSSVPVPMLESGSSTGMPAVTAIPALTSSSAAGETNESVSPADPAQAPEAVSAAASAPVVIQQPVVVAPPPAESGLIELMRENALILLGAGGLLALLVGWGVVRQRKDKNKHEVDSSFLDSRMQPDSFFDASGGRLIDTRENSLEASSLSYSPSQLDASGDVDPVAEADVYLAYGRDQQAEEILRDALRTHPGRIAIYTKLLEIYSKRRDHKAFESYALSAFKLCKGHGPQWAYIAELGRDLDPENITYQSDVGPSDSMLQKSSSAFMPLTGSSSLSASSIAGETSSRTSADMGLDLDLDFSLDHAPATSSLSAEPDAMAHQSAMPASAPLNLRVMDFDLNLDNEPTAELVQSPNAEADLDLDLDLDFISEGMNFTAEPYVPPKASLASAAPATTRGGMLEFDLSSLSLDLDSSTQPSPLKIVEAAEDPLEIKFLLAEEFRILGDADGARSLADEVMAKAKGPLKIKAQAFLNTLS